ncbi:MAG: hypothetical protein HQL77_15715 [Magnetococcales bacterium]|nr:hypothetical protein [Magnetococcales bacterium]
MPEIMRREVPAKPPGAIRIALACNTSGQIDGHFGSCAQFDIYDVSREAIIHVASRSTGSAQDGERTGQRVALVKDCAILGVQSIGGPPAARVVNSGIMPLKFPQSPPQREILVELQRRLDKPPPWMLQAMGAVDTSRLRKCEGIHGRE